MEKKRIIQLLLVLTLALTCSGVGLWAMTGPHEWVYHDPANNDYDDFNACSTCHSAHGAKGAALWTMNTESWADATESAQETLCRSCHRSGDLKANPVLEANGVHDPGHRFIDLLRIFRQQYDDMGLSGLSNSDPVDRNGKTLAFPDDQYYDTTAPGYMDILMNNARRIPCYACHDPHGGSYVTYPMPQKDYNNNDLTGVSHGGYIPRFQGIDYHANNYEEIDAGYNSENIFGETHDSTAVIPSAVDAHNYFKDFLGEGATRSRVRFPFSRRAYFVELSTTPDAMTVNYNDYDPATDHWELDDGGSVCAICHNGVTEIAGIVVPPPPMGNIQTEYGEMEIHEHEPDYAGAQYAKWDLIVCRGCHNFVKPHKVECGGCHGFPPSDQDGQDDNDGAVGAHATHVFGESLSCQNCHYKNTHNESGIVDGADWNAKVPELSFVGENVDINFPTSDETGSGNDELYFVNTKPDDFDAYDKSYGPPERTDNGTFRGQAIVEAYPASYPLTRNEYVGGTSMSNGVLESTVPGANYYNTTTNTCYIGCHNPILFDDGNETPNLDNAVIWPADTATPGTDVPIYNNTLKCVDCHDKQEELFDTGNPTYLTRHPNFLSVTTDSRLDCEQCHQGHQWIERLGVDPDDWRPKLSVNPQNEGDAGTHTHTHTEGDRKSVV